MNVNMSAGTSGTSEKFNESDESFENCTPEEISEKAREITLDLLPNKSKQRYNLQYKLFMDWCALKKVTKYSENVMLTYMSELSQKYKPSTLWSIHSMLKATLLVKHNLNIRSYMKVNAFLKKQSVGHIPKKSKIFTQQEIRKFLIEAPDEIYLMAKVVLIIGIAGACRTDELTNMTIDNIIDKDDILIIHIPDTKTNKQRTFTICNSKKEDSVNIISICKKYFNLRPKNMNSRRLFVKYVAGKCAAQNVGNHTIGSLPSKIATYLNLPNNKDYTGHCLRRTSATLLADSGADILALKRHGGWKSTSVAEGYVEDSIQNKISVAKKILTTDKVQDEIRTVEIPLPNQDYSEVTNKELYLSTVPEQIQLSNLSQQGISFSNCTINNPIFNFNKLND